MEGTVVWRYIIVIIMGIISDTLIVGTLVSAVPSPVHETITQYIPHLQIVIKAEVSFVIMCEDSVHLSIWVRFEVSSVEGRVERVDVGGERRHRSVIRHQRHSYVR